jgi:regulatory protein
MRIDKLSKRGPDSVLVTFDGGYAVKITAAQAAEFGLRDGMGIPDALYAEICGAAARLQAVRALGVRDMSKRELAEKLRRADVNDPIANETAVWCEEMGLISEAGYAESLVRRCAAKGYGAGKARNELFRRGVNRDLWDDALARMPDMEDAAYEMYCSRMMGAGADGAEARRAAQAMRRRGYSWEEISRASDRYAETAGDAASQEMRRETDGERL